VPPKRKKGRDTSNNMKTWEEGKRKKGAREQIKRKGQVGNKETSDPGKENNKQKERGRGRIVVKKSNLKGKQKEGRMREYYRAKGTGQRGKMKNGASPSRESKVTCRSGKFFRY